MTTTTTDAKATPTSAPAASTSRATTTTTPAVAPVRVAFLNVLHGIFCAPETDACQAGDRATMVANALEAADCPELVGFTEIGLRQPDVVPPAMAKVCDGEYELAWQAANSPDRAMIFTRLPIVDRAWLDLAAFPWEAYLVRVDAPMGPIDFLSTHFASSSNNPMCEGAVCPPVCPTGIDTNECNAIEVVTALDARRDGAVLQIASGDFNANPGSPTVSKFTDAKFLDAWLLAGNPECDAATGAGCTGGRDRPENALDGMDAPDGHYSERIDFVMARPSADCKLTAKADPFVAEPLKEPFNGLYWPSDHAGVLAELTCS